MALVAAFWMPSLHLSRELAAALAREEATGKEVDRRE
ncbi:hypothetical protein E9229_002977 [Paeniglutamicibacter cryotolerans]|uniref:Uncharacterized protein n=1 Tax=Paeniglutamicibacter cryotolerans TaxID=670079 RepID=A0A839QLS2_9MICC|nr:hypothetical protein [Paeniglutamicibacter cryotolerans]